MVPNDTDTSIGMEYFCFEGDELWSMNDDDLVAMADAGDREAAPGARRQGQVRVRRPRPQGLSDLRRRVRRARRDDPRLARGDRQPDPGRPQRPPPLQQLRPLDADRDARGRQHPRSGPTTTSGRSTPRASTTRRTSRTSSPTATRPRRRRWSSRSRRSGRVRASRVSDSRGGVKVALRAVLVLSLAGGVRAAGVAGAQAPNPLVPTFTQPTTSAPTTTASPTVTTTATAGSGQRVQRELGDRDRGRRARRARRDRVLHLARRPPARPEGPPHAGADRRRGQASGLQAAPQAAQAEPGRAAPAQARPRAARSPSTPELATRVPERCPGPQQLAFDRPPRAPLVRGHLDVAQPEPLEPDEALLALGQQAQLPEPLPVLD